LEKDEYVQKRIASSMTFSLLHINLFLDPDPIFCLQKARKKHHKNTHNVFSDMYETAFSFFEIDA
jgi:hypothetical protein